MALLNTFLWHRQLFGFLKRNINIFYAYLIFIFDSIIRVVEIRFDTFEPPAPGIYLIRAGVETILFKFSSVGRRVERRIRKQEMLPFLILKIVFCTNCARRRQCWLQGINCRDYISPLSGVPLIG